MTQSAETPEYKLLYFDLRGLGEPIRLIFHSAGKAFDDCRLTPEEWRAKYKMHVRNGVLPMLELNDGRQLHESYAISHYLGKKFGLAGKDEWEEAKVMEVASINRDFVGDIRLFIRSHVPLYTIEQSREELKAKLFDPAIQKYFPIFERILSESGSGFMVPSGLTYVDFYVSEYLSTANNLVPGTLETKSTVLKDYVTRVQQHPSIQNYVSRRKYSQF
ncbi:glutathione S-transferase 1 [Ditylenchus destructor]|nr:glutathione S-transferase 1 [Ditylenchus destructor]